MPMPNARARAATGSDDVPNGARKPTHDLLNYRLSERLAQEELATVYRATHLPTSNTHNGLLALAPA